MTEQLITLEYLLAHGFVQYNSYEEGNAIDIPFTQDYIHFREKELHRQMFVVVFCFSLDVPEGPYSPDVYVQDDIGCGFVEIPFPWVNLTVEYFESVYYGIRGHKPKPTPQDFVDTEYEIVQQKQLPG